MALSNTATPKYYGMFREAVMRGEIPVCEEMEMEMNRIDALIDNPGVWYDDQAIQGFINYCENELTLTDGEDLHLLDSFKLWAEQIFGWYYFVDRSIYEPDPDGHGGHYVTKTLKKRLITKQYLIVARGAAKSMYASCIQNYFLNVDTATTHQVTTAPTMAQAEEVMSPIKTAITRSRGPLYKFLTEGSIQNTTGSKANRVKLASTKKGIQNFLTGSLLEVRPMSIDKLQGLRVKVATVDTKIGSSGLSIYDGVNHLIGQIGYGDTKNKNGDIVKDCFYTLGSRTSGTTIGTFSVAAGSVVEASGHASFAEGFQTKATGLNSHAEGSDTIASGNYSHAEGGSTTASELNSHAEGSGTTASGASSHAEGYHTIASGYVSHAGGYYTKASGDYQTVVGEYNIEDTTSEYLFIVGNGTADNARENALGVTHTGHIDVQKNIYINTNGSGIFERDTDGTNRELIAMDGNNKLSIGYGQYSHGGRETVLQGGNKLTLRLKNPNATWRPYMTKGDSFNTTIQVGGYITNSGKDVTFQLPLNNPVIGSPTVTIASVDGLCVRQNNKYLYGSAASTFAKPSSYSCTLVNGGNHIKITAKMANTTNVENNSACGIYASIKVTFS